MKYGVTMTYTDKRYIEVEAESEEEAIEFAQFADDSDFESQGDDYEYEVEEIEQQEEE